MQTAEGPGEGALPGFISSAAAGSEAGGPAVAGGKCNESTIVASPR